MSPQQLQAWTAAAAALVPVVDGGVELIKSWFHSANPSMTPAEQAAAWDAIISDDKVRSAIAAQEAGDTPSDGSGTF